VLLCALILSAPAPAEFVVDLSSGWLDRLSHKRPVRTGTATQEDVLTIARKPADSR